MVGRLGDSKSIVVSLDVIFMLNFTLRIAFGENFRAKKFEINPQFKKICFDERKKFKL